MLGNTSNVFFFGECIAARHSNVAFSVSLVTNDADWHPIKFDDTNQVTELVHRHLGADLTTCSVWRIDRHRVVVRVPLAEAPSSPTWKRTLSLALAVTTSEADRTGDSLPVLSGLFFYASASSLPDRIGRLAADDDDQVPSLVDRTVTVLGDVASEEANDFMSSVFHFEPFPVQDRRDVVVAAHDWTRDESDLQSLFGSGLAAEIAKAKAVLHAAMALASQRPTFLDLSDVDLGNGRLRVVLEAMKNKAERDAVARDVEVAIVTDCSIQFDDAQKFLENFHLKLLVNLCDQADMHDEVVVWSTFELLRWISSDGDDGNKDRAAAMHAVYFAADDAARPISWQLAEQLSGDKRALAAQVLKLYEEVLPNSIDLAVCRFVVAELLAGEDSIVQYEDAARIFDGRGDVQKHQFVAQIHMSLGNALLQAARVSEAQRSFEKAREIYTALIGSGGDDGGGCDDGGSDGDDEAVTKLMALCCEKLGDCAQRTAVLRAQSKHEAAMEKYEAALQIMKKVFGEEHADVAMCYINMGNVLLEQGKHEAAMEKYEAALQIVKKVSGEEHADVATCYKNMGNVLLEQGKYAVAMEKYEAALQIMKKMSGANSADYSSALLKLASDACVIKSSHDDSHLLAELRRIVDVDAELFNSITPSEFAFGLRDHIKLLRLTALFGQRTGETMALEQWRANVQRLINVSHPVVRALGLQALACMCADGRFASATACESERLLMALRASVSPCALREATGARELSLLGLDGFERVDDDLVAQLMRARALEQDVLQRCAGELSNVKARDTSAEVRNGVADVFVLLLNVLDQAFARLAVASGAKPGNLCFPFKGSAESLANAAGFAQLAADIQQRIEAQQPFSFFKDKSRVFGESEWLHLTTLIANDNKHIKLSQHVHSATLKDKSRGTIEQRDVTLNVSASGPSPDLKNWTLYHWPALAEEVHDDIERRAVSRLARKFLTGVERGADGNTVPVGGVTENKYLEHYHVGACDLFFVPQPIADMDNEVLRRELVKDLQAFDGAQGSQLLRFVDEIQSFLRMRIDWQTPSVPLAEASNEAQIDLVALMRRAIDNTCKLVVEMVDKRVALGRAAIKSGADMFAPVDWLALSDAEARDVVVRGVDEVRASAWSVVDDEVKNLLADSDFAASARAYQRLHAIGRALENDDDVGAFARLWDRVLDRMVVNVD
jgi:tetratricopeptide (TPR) repeat protein